MTPEGSVTRWLQLVKAGDHAAVGPLWERYCPRLVALARGRLQGAPRRAADEEDVVLSAFDSFCRGAERGRFPRLDDRNDLWRLLLVITARKASHLARDERRKGPLSPDTLLDDLLAQGPTPEFAAQFAEECRRLLERLGDEELRSIAVWQMEGYTAAEIADRLGRSERTVGRKLAVIRDRWGAEGGPS
jgi:DNA-directed RNA polymerase specialized sigma24 family protein